LVQFKVPYFKFGVIDEVASWMWWRARGTFFHANHLGMFFVILLPVALRSAISFLLAKNQKFFYISISAFLLGLVALMTTYNRGSWIGFGSGMVVMFSLDLLSRKSKIKKIVRGALIIGVFLGIFVSIKFGGMIIDRVLHSDQKEIMEGREQLQEEAIDTIQQHPVFGVGYFNDRYYSKVIFAHNLYLLVATEVGVPGFIFFAWFLLELLWLVIRGCRSKIPFVYNYSRGLLASLVGFMIASLPGPDFWINEDVQFYFWVVVAITVSLLRMEHKIVTEAEKLIMRKRKAMQMETFPQENYSLS